jgi:HAD superfamily hydrolase (TIGR01549 family)
LAHSLPDAPAPVNSLTGVGFIFDIDGTLYDSGRIHRRLFFAGPWDVRLLLADRRTRKALIGVDYGDADAYYREFFARLSRAAHKSESFIREWYFNAFLPRMCRVLKKHYRPRPGCIELLEALTHNGIKFAVYSDYPLVAERLRALSLNVESSDLLYGPEHFGAQKPAPRPFLAIAEAMGVTPRETLVIGDRDDTDGAGALNAGMCFFRLDDGRKRHFPMDPDRQPPGIPRGCGSWETIRAMLAARLRILN